MDISLFKRIIETNSIYPNESELWDFLYIHLQELWFNVKKQFLSKEFCENEKDKTRFNILAEKWDWDKSLLFYAHMDTVPVHDKELWDTNPLRLERDLIKDNIFYWLWVADMKGWLFSILEAVNDIDFSLFKIKIVFWVDEEYWSKWSHTLIKSNFLDDVKLVVVPELWDSENIKIWTKNLILWRRWRFILKLDIPGKSCHWANAPTQWINAITQASIISEEIDKNFQITKKHSRMPDWNQFVKYFHSSVSSLSVPDKATLYIDRHIIPWETEKSVISEVEWIIDKLYDKWKLVVIWNQRATVKLYDRPTPSSLAYEVDEKNSYVDLFKKSILEQKLKFRVWYWYSVADENVIANAKNIPVITLWPDWWNEHGANEWVDINSIKDLIGIYRNIILKFNNY